VSVIAFTNREANSWATGDLGAIGDLIQAQKANASAAVALPLHRAAQEPPESLSPETRTSARKRKMIAARIF
jgi:hypothetical protein